MLYLRSLNRFILIGLALLGLSISSVNAATYTVDFVETGGNVVGTGHGSLDVTGLTGTNDSIAVSRVGASLGFVFFDNGSYDFYRTAIPDLDFGSGGLFTADFSSGDNVGLWADGDIFYTPVNYVSGTALSASATWSGTTFAILGMDIGHYEYSFGSNTWVVNIGAVPVPAAIWLFGTALIGLVGFGKRKASITA